MSPTAERRDPSKAAGEAMIAAPTHPSLSELQPPQGKKINHRRKEEGETEQERKGVRSAGGEPEEETQSFSAARNLQDVTHRCVG